ncbi:MAG: DUF4422 domain-containing protein [Thermoflexaceae bacterium]|nr:DUF4422 domain-containing protein [Thermoflexaceae bacterium]
MSVRLFIMTHKPFTPPKDPVYVPLHVGRANAEDLGYLGDDTGDSISCLNPYFCELTGMYWLWKNYHETDYIGICHYRRYLINESGCLFTGEQIEKLLQTHDIITTKLLTLTCSYHEGFGANHHIRDLDAAGRVIKEKYPEYLETFTSLVNGPNTYFGNIFITSRKLFDSYCTWLFDILFEVQKQTDFTGYNNYQKRLFGFLSEFLQTVWIRYNKLSVMECMVGMAGDKYETGKLKEQLASFFEKRDYMAAKNHLLLSLKKRPDVLMEASDVTGELRLCMQIISTCEFEDEACGRCVLDFTRDYFSLIRHFNRLNTAVIHFINGHADNRDIAFFKQNHAVTPIAVEIALKLYCSDSSKYSKTIHDIRQIMPAG